MLVPDNFLPLLTVFRYGLPFGLVTKDQITQWADKVITAEDEPDYFFIQLSLARTVDELIVTIDDAIKPRIGKLHARALLGLLYYKLDRLLIDADKAIGIMNSINTEDVLTDYEKYRIYELEEDFDQNRSMPGQEEAVDVIVNFLSAYSAYTLDNWKQWSDVHIDLPVQISAEEIKIMPDDRSPVPTKPKKRFNLADVHPGFWIFIGMLLIWGLYTLIDDETVQTDQYGNSHKLWLVPACFYVGRLIYRSFRNRSNQ